MSQQVKSLSQQVEALEYRALYFEILAADILGCLLVNFARGALTTEDDAQFQKMLNAWHSRMTGIGGKENDE